jgi:outer membrane receptor protein involved in Fe transport
MSQTVGRRIFAGFIYIVQADLCEIAARTYTQWDYSGFFEDSWRVTSKVTATIGVRYEYYTPIAEIHNLIGNWDPTLGLEQVGVNGLKQAYNGYRKDLSPRLGVACDIRGKRTTVIRAGAGM